MTNVIGPKQPIYFCGRRVEDLMFWVPQSGRMGLGVSILSYDGRLTVGVATDEGLVADPECIAEAFDAELAGLVDGPSRGEEAHLRRRPCTIRHAMGAGGLCAPRGTAAGQPCPAVNTIAPRGPRGDRTRLPHVECPRGESREPRPRVS